MTQKKLLELLQFVKKVTVYEYNFIYKTIDAIKNKQAIIISKEWNDYIKSEFLDIYPLNLESIDTWCTYDKCVEFDFYIENSKLLCKAVVYDGRLLNGNRENKRFTAIIEFDNSFVTELTEYIDWKLDEIADNEYDNYLEQQRINWIKDFKQQIKK